MEKDELRNLAIGFVRFAVLSLVILAVMILSSGRLDWIGAWTIFGFSMLYLLVLCTIGLRSFPETVRARVKTKFVHPWDKLAIAVYSICYYSQYVIAGLALRFAVSSFHALSFAIGTVLYGIGMGITFWVLAVNPYATGSARVQDDRGQTVISSGPYRFIRHPMYFTTILFAVSTPLLLCSNWALIPAPLVVGAFLYRCDKEDLMLRKELAGYEEYAQRVKYRMIPLVW